jgi:translation initiation factor 2B subunit (eIF-2B alpha/beta/delta family)
MSARLIGVDGVTGDKGVIEKIGTQGLRTGA